MPAARFMTKRYVDYDFDDECWGSDRGANWNGGSDCYTKTYNCRVPAKMLERAKASGNPDELNDWIDAHNDDPDIWY